jgi:protocatechuate 3,4-dioxygenase beta subunit
MPEAARRHGHIRGWVRTDAEGRYALYTARPAPYPNSNIPAHIHMVVKEPGMSEYYIDDYEFDDDKLLTGAERKKRSSRGGTGVLRPELVNGVQVAERNIILGLNIPDHPAMKTKPKTIGLAVGEEQPSFIPFHAWGPDKGSRACPVCKYGRYQGIIYFLGANPNWDEVKHWLSFLEQESAKRAPYLKVYLVYGDGQNYSSATRNRELTAIGQSLQIKHLALTYVPSFTDVESEIHMNKLNDLKGNVFVVYKQRVITRKFIDIKPTQENMLHLSSALNP